ncbi:MULTISPECIES: MFS transporter [Bacillus]|uniref:Tetracycline resistance protein n=6 Tax=Bacillus cereus group TaxID=86661 RepID=A0AB36TVK4_BACTU|nr:MULTISPECIES: MFS transporter [Bacillus]ACK98378.1 major facilitator family transporter [Bacillus cereus G9842]AEA18176.1 tetracycline resistance protein TETA(L)/TETK [Bacillus thuringiensis serovar chinensis CT-43]AFV20324.1 tetracycline resistance protein, metal-tetracycline/H+ antiporter [Bacillus thuringiensis Bt407]AGG03299.1 major facilitator family transporter [Bacillus thuringiensis serovar thuringiensis str. IS5056]AHA74097.1 major facilitator family transporter [Bacillus thuringie
MGKDISNHSKWFVFTLCFIVLLGPMNAVLFNVALEDIANDLSISQSKVSWVVVGYSLVVGIGSMIYGKLADRYSVKRLLIISIIIFVAGSIVGFVNQSYEIIIFARLVQASGGAAFIALSMIAVAKLVAPAKKPGALAMISSSIALAVGIGPLVGGAITNTLGWPYLFLFMVISMVGIFLLVKFMPEEVQHTDEVFHFDFIGAFLLFVLITTVLLGVNINSWLFVLSVAFLFLFKAHMKRAESPFIDIELFTNKPLLRLIAVGFIINVALCASLLLLPLLLGRGHGLSPFVIGIVLFVASLFGIVSSFITGKIIPAFGNVRMMYVASVVMIIGFLILGIIPDGNLLFILFAVILTFMSYSAIQVSLNTFIPKTLNPAKVGVGLGLYNLINFFGMAFGPAVASKIMESTNSYRLNFILIVILISVHFVLLMGMSSFQKKMEQ